MRVLLSYLFVIQLILFYSCTCSTCGNNSDVPDEIFNKTNSYLIQQLGADFFELYIFPNYEQSLKKNDLYEVRYHFVMDEYDFVNEEILIITDKDGNVTGKYPPSGIPTCVNENGCDFKINKTSAVRIAEEFGLAKGIKEWVVEFRWSEVVNKYVWHIIATIKEFGTKESYKADGEEVMIDPVSGLVLKHREWRIR